MKLTITINTNSYKDRLSAQEAEELRADLAAMALFWMNPAASIQERLNDTGKLEGETIYPLIQNMTRSTTVELSGPVELNVANY
tara:strand:+ start:735 stop:986 length:252 start_codon:yes stop_codon:yes gene_type:complete